MELIPVRMVRENLEDVPRFELPPPYTLRWYRPGDEEAWLEIHQRADKYNVATPELFEQQFGTDADTLGRRQCYLCDPDGAAIGTATAWFDDDYRGRAWGRVHWVAVVPERQGQGLSKPLLSRVCLRLRELGHERAYLSTQTVRIRAINLYLKFGFAPEIEDDGDARAWRQVREQTDARGGRKQ